MTPDPVRVAPNVYRVLFENDRVRLLEARVKPGDSSAMHGHPNYLMYGLSDGTVTFTSSSGESADVEVRTGEVAWREAEQHSAKNPGTTDLVALLFELK